MTCWAVIPIKSTDDCKSRLSPALDSEQRRTLVDAMFSQVLSAAREASAISKILLIGPPVDEAVDGIEILPDPGKGLNPAVQYALDEVAARAPERVLIVFADLPGVSARELDMLAVAPADTVAIAPDRHETGTNAISLPLPAARDFVFAFGLDSFAKHQKEAHRLGLKVEIVFSHGLERDIDEPEDLADAEAILGPDR